MSMRVVERIIARWLGRIYKKSMGFNTLGGK